ncbi:MAG: VWA domain-containing protein [Acidobacteria bacterium]|nr:VWA domain-containing protein [Acidobacteriota bacterium]
MAEVKFMLTKDKSLLWACLLVLLCCAPFAAAQEKEESKKTVQRPSSPTGKEPTDDIVRVNTRVVFIDALVKDKKKDTPVRNLTRDNFTVLDDGQVRELTYFSAGSETRRPRMLMLVLDFFGGDGRAFHDKEIVAGLASVLAKLPPEDEVAIATTWLGRDTSPCSPVEQVSPDFPPLQVLQDFTRDRGKIISSLEAVPDLVTKYNQKSVELRDAPHIYENAASGIPCAAAALRRAVAERLNSQAVMIVATDDLVYFPFNARDEMIRSALETGITINLLRIRTSFFTGLLAGAVKKGAGYRKVPGTIDVVADAAQQTGGGMARVGSVKKYVQEFEKLIGNLTSRYTLGFTIEDNEQNTNRLHKLEIRVKANDERGKERKVVVSARNGYYLPNK